jgi:Na+/H+ antiporter NhaD/arsenite permease-like protein
VALFGSMVALMFPALSCRKGETETIRQIMLNLELSTTVLGMMLIVGELSHTGIFGVPYAC